MPRFLLQARGIRKAFGGVEVLHGVNLDATGGVVLALLGENGAGKSTLVKILGGDYQADAGTLEIAGEVRGGIDPIAARRRGIRMITQELAGAPELTVAENVMLGQWPTHRGLVNWRALRRSADELLTELGVSMDTEALLSDLGVAERQVVEIARALTGEARCLILDEPTAALSHEEVEQLYAFILRLRARGAAIVYITHRLEEVARIADRVQVLRDGTSVLEGPVADYGKDDIVRAMVGKAVGSVTRPASRERNALGGTALRFVGATCGDAFQNLDLALSGGEVLCLYGQIGSGTAEVAEVAYGLRQLTGGSVKIGVEEVEVSSPVKAIGAGVGFLPADRQRDGTFTNRSVAENLCAPSWPRLSRARVLISETIEATAYRRWHEILGIRSQGNPNQVIGTLSGGNQQKVLLGRWLELGSRVLVLAEPTRGIDVGARQEIYRSIRQLADGGAGVLVVTSDYEEVVQVADRAVVMARGVVTADIEGDAISVEGLISAAGE